LLTIARHQSINVFTALKRKAVRFLSDAASNDPAIADSTDSRGHVHRGPETELSVKQEFSRVHAALQSLPERQRSALLLKAQEDMSYEEIAAVMQVTVSSVESLIFRARRKLLELLED
jgi:RNA polymerase sigma-70 factor (ECF subfamily)